MHKATQNVDTDVV